MEEYQFQIQNSLLSRLSNGHFHHLQIQSGMHLFLFCCNMQFLRDKWLQSDWFLRFLSLTYLTKTSLPYANESGCSDAGENFSAQGLPACSFSPRLEQRNLPRSFSSVNLSDHKLAHENLKIKNITII